jgi:lysozyme family protein
MTAITPAYQKALAFTLREEGGYSDTPGDHGRATDYGVTQKTYDEWRTLKKLPLQPVKFITQDEVTALYWDMFWIPGHCNALPENLGAVHFDTCVNSGWPEAAKLLQRALCVPADGDIGPETIAAANKTSTTVAVTAYCHIREAFDRAIARNDASQRKFLQGWLNRIERLRKTFG